jgi:hypothetical protein
VTTPSGPWIGLRGRPATGDLSVQTMQNIGDEHRDKKRRSAMKSEKSQSKVEKEMDEGVPKENGTPMTKNTRRNHENSYIMIKKPLVLSVCRESQHL